MPNRDRTGPEGRGARTGRQQGNCEGARPNGSVLRLGLGRGAGAGRRPRFRRR